MFDDRLTELREKSGKTKKEIALALNMPYNTYSNYENDEREPSSEVLIKIADFYDVSIDYLLGRTKIKNTKEDIKGTAKTTGLSERSIETLNIIKKLDYTEYLKTLDMLIEDMYNTSNNIDENDQESLIALMSLYITQDLDDNIKINVTSNGNLVSEHGKIIANTIYNKTNWKDLVVEATIDRNCILEYITVEKMKELLKKIARRT